MTRYVIYQKH